MCDNKFVQFLSNMSSFLRIMITNNVDFCMNDIRFMPLTIPILLLITKMTRKQLLFHLWKIKAEDRCALTNIYWNIVNEVFRNSVYTSMISYNVHGDSLVTSEGIIYIRSLASRHTFNKIFFFNFFLVLISSLLA